MLRFLPTLTPILFLFLPLILTVMEIQGSRPLLRVPTWWCSAVLNIFLRGSFQVPEPASSHLHSDSQCLQLWGKPTDIINIRKHFHRLPQLRWGPWSQDISAGPAQQVCSCQGAFTVGLYFPTCTFLVENFLCYFVIGTILQTFKFPNFLFAFWMTEHLGSPKGQIAPTLD